MALLFNSNVIESRAKSFLCVEHLAMCNCCVIEIRVCDTQLTETAEHRDIRGIHNANPYLMLGI